MLPISTTNHDGFSNFPVSFFTAVSALSTCGIPVVNTGEYWSMFGQLVILFSIQFGGLGVMTLASIVALGGYSAGVASAGNPACLFILAAAMIVGRGSVIITGNLLNAGISDLWAKSVSQKHARILQRIGAHHIINAETDAGKRVGHLVAGNYLDYIEIDGPYNVVKIHTPLYAVGRNIEDVQRCMTSTV